MCETINAGKKEGKMIGGELKEDAIVISGIPQIDILLTFSNIKTNCK